VPVFGGGNPPAPGGFFGDLRKSIGRVVQHVMNAAAPAARGTAFSLAFLLLLLMFLLVHSYIDRRDPKLANAPMLPNFLHFEPPRPGGSHDLT